MGRLRANFARLGNPMQIATWGRSLTIWHVPQYRIPYKNKKQPPTKLLFQHKETRCPPIPYAQ